MATGARAPSEQSSVAEEDEAREVLDDTEVIRRGLGTVNPNVAGT